MSLKLSSGFALPTVLVASVVMLVVLLSAVQSTVASRTALDAQYYAKLNEQAVQSGQAKAEACLKNNNNVPSWSDASPLRPNTNCSGGAACTNTDACFVLSDGNVRSTFEVPLPVVGTNQYVKVVVNSKVELIRESTNLPWRSYSDSTTSSSRYANLPQISAGSGWIDSGHMAFVVNSVGELYGFGANDGAQINDTISPTFVITPKKITLPDGVASVKKVVTSGIEAYYVCIIGSDMEAYCRGVAMNYPITNPSNFYFPVRSSWNRVGIPANLNVYDIVSNGMGENNTCVMAGTSMSDAQSYCFGSNAYGMLGNGDSNASSYYNISNPQKFILPTTPSVMTAKKIMIQDYQNCVITNLDDMYCAGRNDFGQITGSAASHATPVKYNLPSMGSVVRKAKDVLMQYAGGGNTVHVLATDGTIWSSGNYVAIDMGNGLSTGSTGLNGTPSWFGDAGYGRGGGINNNGMCLDNSYSSSAEGNAVVMYVCSATPNQSWFATEQGSVLNQSTGKCLGTANATAGTNIGIYTCTGGPTQIWRFNSDGTIQNVSSGLCIATEGNSIASLNPAEINSCGTMVWNSTSVTKPWKGMISGPNYFCGLREDPSWTGAWCGGQNNYGQLGNVSPSGGHGGQCAATADMWNMNFGGGTDNEQVDISKLTTEWQYQYNSMMVITKSGKVFGGGRNVYGKLGNGVTGDSANSYRQCTTVQFQLPAGVKAMALSTRDEFTTYVLGDNGKVYASGRNINGQLGNGTTTDSLTPQLVKMPRVDMMY